MASLWALKSILAIVISFLIGFLFFYIISPLQQAEKKRYLEEITSLLINFIIYIWIGKILWNITIFISDPLAVLAYPSNSSAFYIAFVLIMMNVVYKIKRQQLNVIKVIYVFVPTFITASFIYEFIQMMFFNKGSSWIYLALLMLLICLWIYLDGRMSNKNLGFSLLIGWTAGKLVLALTLPITTVYGYLLSPGFYLILLIIWILLYWRLGTNDFTTH